MQKLNSLRVCHLASGDLWAGAEVQLASLLRELRKDPLFDLRAILLNKGVLYDRLIAFGIPTQVFDERVLSSAEITRRVYQCSKEWKPHIVHTHRYKEDCLGGLAAWCAHVPVIVHTVHGIHEALSGWDNIKYRVYSLLARQVTRWFASGLIGVSFEVSAMLKKHFPRLEVACIHNGIQCDVRAEIRGADVTRETVGVRAQAFLVGTVGRLTPVKGIEYLLRAAALLVRTQTVPWIQVLIVGEGPLRTELEVLAQRLGISEHVRFLGERQDVEGLLGLLDVFVLPSLHEGIPIALLEAMRSGCPVIASAVGGIPEVIRDGVEGVLVPSKDAESLARAISAMYDSMPERARFSRAGQERVATEFSSDLMASRTKHFYMDLFARAK
jgi:glycosyltransferase involved in cell wall biosynthesis